MVSKCAALLLFLCVCAFGTDVRIGVLGLFRPEHLVVTFNKGAQVRHYQIFLRGDSLNVNGVLRKELRLTDVSELVLSIPGRVDRHFKGAITVLPYKGAIQATIQMPLEDAVAAVVAAEMLSTSPDAALEAMAVLARSYYSAAERRHTNYDFCDTTHCQFQRGPAAANTRAAAAARRTAGLVLFAGDSLFAPMYSASCGGTTMSAEETGLHDPRYRYSKIQCDVCRRDATRWIRKLPDRLAARLFETRSEKSRLEITRQLGWKSIPGNNYTARLEGNQVVLEGSGEGHGIGFCQRGAIGLARAGMGFREILQRYLPGVLFREAPR